MNHVLAEPVYLLNDVFFRFFQQVWLVQRSALTPANCVLDHGTYMCILIQSCVLTPITQRPPQHVHTAGLWSVSLAAGRSTELYDTIHAPDLQRRFNTDRQGLVKRAPALAAVPVLLHSLSGQLLDLPVRKKPERASDDVLEVRCLTCWSARKSFNLGLAQRLLGGLEPMINNVSLCSVP